MVNIFPSNLRVHIRRHNKSQEKLHDKLKVRPRRFQQGLVLLGVINHPRGKSIGSKSTKQIGRCLCNEKN